MAAVLNALAAYVTKLITDMAEEKVHLLLGVSDEIDKLGQNLDNLKAFLADAERQRITDQLVQRWVRMLKDVMYDATDILELIQLKGEKWRESMGGSVEKMPRRCYQPFLLCLRNPLFAHKIGSRINKLNQRLNHIHGEAAKFNFTAASLSSYLEKRRMLIEAEYSSQKMTSEFIPSTIVGEKIERDTKLLVQELIMDDNFDMKVVSIVGMGGMGKTTLAQKIFKDSAIDEHFKLKIWLSITQNFDAVELLRTAIKHAGGDPGKEQDNTLLTQTVTNILSTSKFLLVLDDIWSVRAWECVLSVPVTNASHKQPGSKVLVTTRFEDLAPRFYDAFYQHHVSPLDDEDAWSMLKRQLPQRPNQVAGIDHLKNVGMKIIRKCGGLPLAIKVMGGLLRMRHQSESSNINVVIPKGFRGLTNLRTLSGFPANLDMNGVGGWCSLDEIGPLSKLRKLTLYGLEKLSASSAVASAEKAKISSKRHLWYSELHCSNGRFMGLMDDIEKQQQQLAVEGVFENLCPPSCIEDLRIYGYFGCKLPYWMMMVQSTTAFKSLRYLTLEDLPCCTQLPDGLRGLPSLVTLDIIDATAIKNVGSEFQASSSVALGDEHVMATSAAFPNLEHFFLKGLCEWEEWEWEEQDEGVTADVMAMIALKTLKISNCKLSCLPPGLASSKRHALRELNLHELINLRYVENFPSVVELEVFDCPMLKRISSLARLQKIRIVRCPNLEVLQSVPALDTMELWDATMETLPEYLRWVIPRYLELDCSMKLHKSLLIPGSSESEKISHIKKRNINYVLN
ncbi:hypothetical protein QOZ80_9AG0692080 [Eleusine coracana subsp. coracana]|nr:hypothetical protein QOZ80_9AG0692080 [Eleusine coracana subsp. coracana]